MCMCIMQVSLFSRVHINSQVLLYELSTYVYNNMCGISTQIRGGSRGAGAPLFKKIFVHVVFTLYSMKISFRDV